VKIIFVQLCSLILFHKLFYIRYRTGSRTYLLYLVQINITQPLQSNTSTEWLAFFRIVLFSVQKYFQNIRLPITCIPVTSNYFSFVCVHQNDCSRICFIFVYSRHALPKCYMNSEKTGIFGPCLYVHISIGLKYPNQSHYLPFVSLVIDAVNL